MAGHPLKTLVTSSSKKRDKEKARKACLSEGAQHVDIHSSDENNFVCGLIPSNTTSVSIGYQRNTAGSFAWDRTNDAGMFTHWNSGEPSNTGEYGRCADMERTETGKWNDIQCSANYSFVCKAGQ